MRDFNDPNFPFGPEQWRRFEQMARRGMRGMRGMRDFARFGDVEGWGENFKIGRMLASGDLRLVALFLIEQQPRHGYDLIKAIEEKTQGFYVPSPGVIYPALTFLEEAGFVTASAEGNKKLYTITDEGRAHLSENRKAVESTLDYLGKMGAGWNDWRDRMAKWRDKVATAEAGFAGQAARGFGGQDETRPADRDIPGVLPEVNEARRALKGAIAEALAGGEQAQRRLADILRRAAEDIRREVGRSDVDLG